jgi:ferredoxin
VIELVDRLSVTRDCSGIILRDDESDAGQGMNPWRVKLMTTVVCEPCYDCKYTDCVAVCPVECFWQDEEMLYIDPKTCVDCEACIPECPVEAIAYEYHEGSGIPSHWRDFIQINRERVEALKHSGEGHITSKAQPQLGPDCARNV